MGLNRSVPIAFVLILGVAQVIDAQPARRTKERPSAASSNPSHIGVRGYAAVDLDMLAAEESFNAVLGTSRLRAFGGGADVLNLWKNAFVRVAASRIVKGGNRSFVVNGQTVSLGVPITVTMTPLEIGGGWRFPIRAAPRVTPYVGVALVMMRYEERSRFAGTGDDVSQLNRGYTVVGGAEVRMVRWIVVGAEAQYRGVPHAIGKGSVSQDFGENNLGGFAIRGLVGLRR